MTDEKWLGVAVVATKLNVSVATVYRLIDTRNLDSRKVGVKGCTQISAASVREFIASRAGKVDA